MNGTPITSIMSAYAVTMSEHIPLIPPVRKPTEIIPWFLQQVICEVPPKNDLEFM